MAAMPHRHQFAHLTRRPPYGGRRVNCAKWRLRGTATMECVSDCISEQATLRNALRYALHGRIAA
eukprot:9104568-Lingulodinium_polyedra.AAC.1